MKTARLVKDMGPSGSGAEQRLYRLSDTELSSTGYVVVSAVAVPYGGGPETYIFASNAEGEIDDWGELNGSFSGGLDHEKALRGAGYRIKREAGMVGNGY
jgi:hypothetical protein